MNASSELGLIIFCATLCAICSCTPAKPASREDRLKWNLTTLTNDYATAGRSDAKWDADAREALIEYARSRAASDDEVLILSDLVAGAADSAVAAGCDDPMVRYLAVRFGAKAKALPLADRKEWYRAAASNLELSAYAPLRKFYANADAAGILYVPRDEKVWPLVRQFRSAAVADLDQAYRDPSLPEAEAYQAADTLFDLLQHNSHELTNAYDTLAATLAGAHTKPAVAALVRAEFYERYAWIGRGHGTAAQVTPEGWRMFHERLAEAESALERAWSKDPYDSQIPTLMISVVLGQEKPRAEMEQWFQRAMKLDPNNYQACRAKLHYLLPQWYGSRDEMLAFGRECVAATNWGGRVPLTLVDAHSEFDRTLSGDEREDYWSLPDVWPDISAAYERYAQAEPDATKFRYPYAWYAFRCGQMHEFLEQLKRIREADGAVHESYFGGKETLDKLIAVASAPPRDTGPANSPSK